MCFTCRFSLGVIVIISVGRACLRSLPALQLIAVRSQLLVWLKPRDTDKPSTLTVLKGLLPLYCSQPSLKTSCTTIPLRHSGGHSSTAVRDSRLLLLPVFQLGSRALRSECRVSPFTRVVGYHLLESSSNLARTDLHLCTEKP